MKTIMPNFSTVYIDPVAFTFGISEGEKDSNLHRCFVKTESINVFVHNIQDKNYVIAPKGFGKSGLCSMITDPQNNLLSNKDAYIYMNSVHCEQIVEYCTDVDKLKYNLISYFLNSIAQHLLKAYDVGMESPISKLREMMSRSLTLDSVEVKGGITVGALIGDVTGKWTNAGPEISTTHVQVFEQIEEVLISKNKRMILCVDNLDDITKRMDTEKKSKVLTAFYDAIQLIRKWGESKNPLIMPVLFIRDDLFRLIDRQGESDKRSFITELSWNQDEITRFIVKRFMANDLMNDIRREIRMTNLQIGKIRSFLLNKRDLSWVDQLTSKQVVEIFKIFFTLDVNETDFYLWLTQILCDHDNTYNPRTVIDYFDMLLKCQHEQNKSEGITEVPYENGHYQVFTEKAALDAFRELQQHKMDDCVDLISIGKIKKSTIKGLIEHIVIRLNRSSTLSGIQYEQFGLTSDEYYKLIEKMEFYRIIKPVSGKPPYQKYILSPIMRNYRGE